MTTERTGGRPHDDDDRVLSRTTIMWVTIAIVAGGVGVTVWLLLSYGSEGESNRNLLDAIRTAGTIVIGMGGAAALMLAARRQRSTELTLQHQRRVAEATNTDAVERRITELYTKAADQLGSDKAPVRLAGLYALERLAQSNPSQRQTIVNVLCAYLRMPHAPTSASRTSRPLGIRRTERPHRRTQGSPTPRAMPPAEDYSRQEREVRLTAQRILTGHLRPGPDARRLFETFWDNIDLDLTGATLIDLDLFDCDVRTGQFDGAHFAGDAGFDGAHFTGDAGFDGAHFTGDAGFNGTYFAGDAGFYETRFSGTVGFDRATFTRDARFTRTQFTVAPWFERVQFGREVPPVVTHFLEISGESSPTVEQTL